MNTEANFDSDRVASELARERRERILHDEERAGLSDESRIKDARESMNSSNLKRHFGH
jgi:hypothetical protein